ncbi:hypothetical protein [Oscillatoria salina]|uniref:hypothetical protein n=1 Tax=Oscillatoria salina TaxID=331517 RepID=UPI001CCDE142|nr:hypothetical protein [Oscillatoria salina]
MNLVFVGLVGAIIVIYISSRNWQRAVKAALVIVVIEGALRKWAFPQASQLIYFLKDFVLIGAYLSYFSLPKSRRRVVKDSGIIKVLLFLVIVWCLFQAFNPRLGSPIIGLIGLKNYLLYIPLLWVVPYLFQSEEELYKFLRSYLLLLIPVGLLAIAQFFSPPTSPLNVYASDDLGIARFGGNVRVTGTFSYITGYTTFLTTCTCFLLPMLTRKQPLVWQLLTITELLFVAVTSTMTGSRGIMIIFALLLVGYFGLQGVTEFSNFLRSIRKLLVPGVIAISLTIYKFSSTINQLWARGGNSEDILPRIVGSFIQPLKIVNQIGLDGYGTGSTFQANGTIRGLLSLPPGENIPFYYEGELIKIAIDLGAIGFFLWYTFKLILVFYLWTTYRQLKRPFLRQLALCAFLISVILFTGQLVYNHTAGLYHWFFNSFIFLLPQLEQIENWQEYQQLQQLWQFYEQSPDISSSPDQ